MKTVVFIVSFVTVVGAELQISNQECQCTGPCSANLFVSLNPLDKFCEVDVSVCTDASVKSRGMDQCGSWVNWLSWVTNLIDVVTGHLPVENIWGKIWSWSKENLALVGKEVQDAFPLEKLQEFTKKIGSITVEDVASWSAEQWEKVPIENLALMGWRTLQQVPLKEIGEWTQEMWEKMPVEKLVMLTGEQIAKLNPNKIGDFTQRYWDKVPVYHIVKFGTELLQSLDIKVVSHLNASHVAYLTADQWRSVPLAEITALTAEKLQAIDYTALGEFTKQMWDAVPIDKLGAFAGKQIEKIRPEVVSTWAKDMWLKFDASAAVMFTGEQLEKGYLILANFTEEQLSNFDWGQLSEASLAKMEEISPELRAKVDRFLSVSKAEFKKLVAKVQELKERMEQAYLEWQTLLASPSASADAIKTAEATYNAAIADHALEVAKMDVWLMSFAPKSATCMVAAFISATILAL